MTAAQFQAALDECEGFTKQMPEYNKLRLRALLMLMRFSGLRISDAVVLKADAISGDVLHILTKKASTPVQIPLHPDLAVMLKQLKPYEGGYYFWNRRTDTSKASTVQHNYTAQIGEIFRNAGIKGGSGLVSHSLRNSFAVHLLEWGLPLETVSLLLEHKSVTTTEKYYADFSKGFMDGIEARVRRIWNGESLA